MRLMDLTRPYNPGPRCRPPAGVMPVGTLFSPHDIINGTCAGKPLEKLGIYHYLRSLEDFELKMTTHYKEFKRCGEARLSVHAHWRPGIDSGDKGFTLSTLVNQVYSLCGQSSRRVDSPLFDRPHNILCVSGTTRSPSSNCGSGITTAISTPPQPGTSPAECGPGQRR
jgi:hypothetical protein